MKVLLLVFAALNLTAFTASASDVLDARQADAIEMNNDCTDGKVITRRAAIHSHSYDFRCNYSQRMQAERNAEESAKAACYKAGFDLCRSVMTHTVQEGYLGYQEGFKSTLGYGCLAEAIVRGSNY